jgi:hypothetical protein
MLLPTTSDPTPASSFYENPAKLNGTTFRKRKMLRLASHSHTTQFFTRKSRKNLFTPLISVGITVNVWVIPLRLM